MILFVTSLLYVALLFVLPGHLLIRFLAGLFTMPVGVTVACMHCAAYAALLGVVLFSRHAYGQLLMQRERGMWEVVRKLLQMRGHNYFWINPLGLMLAVAGGVLVLGGALLPDDFVFLFAAIALGLFHLPAVSVVEENPEALPGMRPCESQQTGETEYKKVELTWSFSPSGLAGDGSAARQKVRAAVAVAAYEQAGRKAHPAAASPREFARYVHDGLDPALHGIAAELRKQTVENKFTPLMEAENVLAMVRAVPYGEREGGDGTAERVRFPVEALFEVEQGWGREDRVIVAAAILHLLGHKVGLLVLDMQGVNRVALAYAADMGVGCFCCLAGDDTRYYYVDTLPVDVPDKPVEVTRDFLRELGRAQVVPV